VFELASYTTLTPLAVTVASGAQQPEINRAVDSESTMSFLIGPVSGALVAGGVRRSLVLCAVIPESFHLDLLWFLQLD
jgi:hypothetical protein